MKILIHPVQKLPRWIVHPLNRTALPLFFAPAFLPSILCLVLPGFSVTNPISAIGPVLSAFWLAASLRGIRISFVLLGALMATLLWSVNWIMMAGDHCCLTMGRISP